MKVKLIRSYPLKNAFLTIGNVYEVYDEQIGEKSITANQSISINIYKIKNDKDVLIPVNGVFFEIIDTNN